MDVLHVGVVVVIFLALFLGVPYLVILLSRRTSPKYTTLKGELNGSKFIIRIPKKGCPSNRVLIYCHGYRPRGISLQAVIPSWDVYEKLLQQGWIISALSYRREGYILEDAMEDLNILRSHILQTCFPNKSKRNSVDFVIFSQSMGICNISCLFLTFLGGAISTLVAERYPKLYKCVFAIGAALFIDPVKERENNNKKTAIDFIYKPQIPILYLMNESETAPIRSYLKRIEDDELKKNVFLWYVQRPGHCYVNDEEVEKCLLSIIEYSFHENEETLEHEKNVTCFAKEKSLVQYDESRGGSQGIVESISIVGDVVTSFQSGDLRKLRIRLGNTFQLLHGNNCFEVLYGNFPFVGIEDKELVAYNNASRIIIKRHSIKTVKNDICEFTGIKDGDRIFVQEKPKQPRTKSTKLSSSMMDRIKKFE